jgi:hypothetical protein
LDTARLADVFVEDSNGKNPEDFLHSRNPPKDFFKDKDHQAVVNDRTNKIEAIVSDQYALIQHREAFEPFVAAMRTLGIGVKGRVISDSGRAYIDVRFDDERFQINVSPETQKGDLINFGFRLGNSYDKSTAFYAETYALRLVCLNGMIAPVKIKAIREVHIGDVRIVTKTLSVAIKSLAENSVKFADIVERARKDYPEAGIKAGEPYYWWKFNFQKHVFRSKTAPRRSQLTQSDFLGRVWDIEDRIGELAIEDDLESEVESLKSELEELSSEQDDKLSNMPDQLQDAPTGQILSGRVESVDSMVSDLDSVDFEVDEEQFKQDAIDEVKSLSGKEEIEFTDNERANVEAVLKDKIKERREEILEEIQGVSYDGE